MADMYEDNEETVADSPLAAEYDEVFDGDEKANNLLKITTDSFTREFKRIKIKEIGFTEPIKKGRQNTVSGLTKTVQDIGVVTPIHVMTVPEEDADDDYKYILLDGLRRVFASAKNSQEDIDAIVWDFKNKDQGSDLALYLSLILNRKQKRDYKEIWHLYQVLEMQSPITPGTLEYLLELESGDAMKLKDVMLCDYDEVKEGLLSGQKTLEQAYKMLTKLRKEEDKIENDDATGISGQVEGSADLVSSDKPMVQLSDEDTKELLDMLNDIDDELSEDGSDFDGLNESAFGDEQQIVGERHPLDPALRQAVLARDNFTCKCCGMKMIGSRLGLIAIHHVLPVHTGGKDTLENLTTLCVNDHIALHIMERNGGLIMMSKEQFDELPRNEQSSLVMALKLARIAIEADKRKGYTKEQVKEFTKSSVRHIMPGDGLEENQMAYGMTKGIANANANTNTEDDEDDEDEEE